MSWGLFRKHPKLLGASWAITACIAWFAPEALLASSRLFHAFMATLSVFVPSLSYIGRQSAFPETMRLYFAVAWMFVPAYVAVMRASIRNADGHVILLGSDFYKPAQEASHWRRGGVMLVCLVVAGYSWAFYDGGDLFGTAFSTSRLFLGAFGLLLPFGTAFAIAVLLSARTLYRANREAVDKSNG